MSLEGRLGAGSHISFTILVQHTIKQGMVPASPRESAFKAATLRNIVDLASHAKPPALRTERRNRTHNSGELTERSSISRLWRGVPTMPELGHHHKGEVT